MSDDFRGADEILSVGSFSIESVTSVCSLGVYLGTDQPEPPAVAIVRQNGLSSASSRASVADTLICRWTCT